jgi:hypothetical protein
MGKDLTGLDESTKNRIWSEERFREEVRKQLEEQSSKEKPGKWLKFLNSSFGLWVLSAVFISGAGGLYTQWHTSHQEGVKLDDQRRTEEKRLVELHERMKLEIAHRLSQTLIRLSDAADSGQPERLRKGRTEKDVRVILEDFATGTGIRLAPLYADLANQTTLAMVVEVSASSKSDQSAQLKRAVEDLSGLFSLMEVEKAPLSNPVLVAGALQKRLDALKFTSEFYFLDCPPENPFC